MSGLTLITEPANFRAIKILIAAEYNNVDIAVPAFDPSSLTAGQKVPQLVTPQGQLFESNAIARYVARMRTDTELLGSTFFQSAQVDSWIDFSAHEIELPASIWVYPILGFGATSPALTAKAKGDLARSLAVLEAHLADKTYLVGEHITLADIAVASALLYPFKFVLDPTYTAPFPNVVRWFLTSVNQKPFKAVIGEVVLAKQEIVAPLGSSSSGAAPTPAPAAAGGKKVDKAPKEKADKPKAEKPSPAPKQEKAPKEKKPAPKDDDDEPEPDYVEPKKEEHPFKLLDKSSPTPFVMDTWKKTYSNAADYAVAMDTFWSTFDPNGWSLFRGDYQYNEECKVLFMTSNLIGGFIQRTEEIRKWLFGTMTIRGVEGEAMKITCYYLIRGDSIEPLIKCNDDAACYTWTKVASPVSAEDKAKIFEYWCSEVSLEGEPLLDSRCYK